MNDKKKAAAMSAVLHYIRTEQEAAAVMAAQPSDASRMPFSASGPVMAFKPWGMSGRQAQMQMRNLMQLRTFRKLR
jgi:hypothetical protein